MTNVVDLSGMPLDLAPETSAEIREVLITGLGHMDTRKICAVAVAMVDSEGNSITRYLGQDRIMGMLAAVTVLQRDILADIE
jgi:hypothetical protein